MIDGDLAPSLRVGLGMKFPSNDLPAASISFDMKRNQPEAQPP
jgi:hypothetical protein